MNPNEYINLDTLKAEELEVMHDEMHSYFSQLLAGTLKGWTFSQIYRKHSVIYNALIRAGGTHISPIDKLDTVQILEEGNTESNKGGRIIAKVLAVNRIKGDEDIFYYNMGIEGNTQIGKTSNTKIKANAGDKLEVMIEGLDQYMNPKTAKTWFDWENPQVLVKSSKAITSIIEAKKIVVSTSGKVGEKETIKLHSLGSGEMEQILIEDVSDFNPSKSDDEELINDHRIAHTWYSSLRMGKVLKFSDGSEMTIKSVKLIHDKIVEEMMSRGMEHNSPLSADETETLSQKEMKDKIGEEN